MTADVTLPTPLLYYYPLLFMNIFSAVLTDCYLFLREMTDILNLQLSGPKLFLGLIPEKDIIFVVLLSQVAR